MVDQETTAGADTSQTWTEPEQTESDGNAGQQPTNPATPPLVAAPPAAATLDALPKKRWWNRLRAIKPSAFVALAVLAFLAALSIVGGLAFAFGANTP